MLAAEEGYESGLDDRRLSTSGWADHRDQIPAQSEIKQLPGKSRSAREESCVFFSKRLQPSIRADG
jgi:hypothetical protein